MYICQYYLEIFREEMREQLADLPPQVWQAARMYTAPVPSSRRNVPAPYLLGVALELPFLLLEYHSLLTLAVRP